MEMSGDPVEVRRRVFAQIAARRLLVKPQSGSLKRGRSSMNHEVSFSIEEEGSSAFGERRKILKVVRRSPPKVAQALPRLEAAAALRQETLGLPRQEALSLLMSREEAIELIRQEAQGLPLPQIDESSDLIGPSAEFPPTLDGSSDPIAHPGSSIAIAVASPIRISSCLVCDSERFRMVGSTMQEILVRQGPHSANCPGTVRQCSLVAIRDRSLDAYTQQATDLDEPS